MIFDRIVCLNVDKRFEERDRISKEFAALGNVEFFLAGDGKAVSHTYDHIDVLPKTSFGYPWHKRVESYNAYLCFQKIIAAAIHDDISCLLLLEDDATVTPEFLYTFPAVIEQLNSHDGNWDMLYLGANHSEAKTSQVAPNLLRLLGGSLCFHAVALRKNVFQPILDLPMNGPIDLTVSLSIQPKYKCFAVYPSVVIQKPGFSYCDGRVRDYMDLFLSKGYNAVS